MPAVAIATGPKNAAKWRKSVKKSLSACGLNHALLVPTISPTPTASNVSAQFQKAMVELITMAMWDTLGADEPALPRKDPGVGSAATNPDAARGPHEGLTRPGDALLPTWPKPAARA